MTRTNADRARVTLDAVEIMDALGSDTWSEADVLELSEPADVVAGLREYANYLEALLVMRGISVEQLRTAARDTARKLARR